MTIIQMLNSSNNSFSPWSGKVFDSDIVRSAIRPKVNAIGKLGAKHIRGYGADMKINPVPSIISVLEMPNKYMSLQDLLCKLVFQRELNHNAFAFIKRDDYGIPLEVYPIPANRVELYEKGEDIYYKFHFKVGMFITLPYDDVIHMRKDFNENDFYGDSGYNALKNLMEVIDTTDKGIINAIKNSAIVKWIMKFKNVLQPKDKEIQIQEFVKNYLDIDKSSGVATADPRYDLDQVEEKNYVPNAAQMDKAIQRIYSYFGVNDKIVQNKYTEDEWNAFYESEIEPIIIQLSNAFTRAFFSRRELGFGNRIVFASSSLQYASMSTKLGLDRMVDRGALTPNEWREILNLAPVEGGDKPIRRLDTAQVGKEGSVSNDGNKSTGEDGKTK
ncbi:MAG: phage portal protein [Bacillota bacterium]